MYVEIPRFENIINAKRIIGAVKVISFRSQLKGTLSDFLAKEGMQCPQTEDGLLELVVALSNYTEEGHSLFPQVILCEDLETTLRILQCSDPLPIGNGPKNKATMIEALKRCAPLARDVWIVYLQRFEDSIAYGVLRRPYSPIALDIRDTVQALNGEKNSPHLILATQLADKAVELVGTYSGVLNIYLSATPDDAPSPHNSLDSLVDKCCHDITPGNREQVQSFLKSTLSTAMRHSHGTLIVILSLGGDPKDVSTDGVIFSSPIPLANIIEQHETERNDQSHAALMAYGNLLAGMLSSDGIVLIDSACRVIGYNLFVQETESSDSALRRSEGGARHRAFRKLCRLVDNGVISACFIRSSDGTTKFHGRCEDEK